jgi:hypothetical protein
MARTRLIRLTRRAQAALDASLDAGAVAKQGGEGVSEGVEDVRFRYNPAADVLAVEGNDDEEEILLHEMRAEEAREWYERWARTAGHGVATVGSGLKSLSYKVALLTLGAMAFFNVLQLLNNIYGNGRSLPSPPQVGWNTIDVHQVTLLYPTLHFAGAVATCPPESEREWSRTCYGDLVVKGARGRAG